MQYLTFLPRCDDVESAHRDVMALFPHVQSDTARADANSLWRQEANRIAVVSTVRPEAADVTILEDTFTAGETVQFAVTVSAVTRNGKYERPAADPTQWLSAKVAAALTDVEAHFITSDAVARRGGTLIRTSIVGSASVVDADALTALVRRGVGRGRAFGCGLLTLRQPRTS